MLAVTVRGTTAQRPRWRSSSLSSDIRQWADVTDQDISMFVIVNLKCIYIIFVSVL